MTGAVSSCMRPTIVEPKPHGRGRIGQADLDLEGPGHRVGLRGDLPHASGRRHRGIVGQVDRDQRIARRRPQHLRRHVEHGVAPILAGDAHDHLPGLHHLAGLRAGRDHGAGRIHPQFGVADPVLGGLQLRLGGIELRPRGLQRRLGLFELRTRGDVPGQKRFLTLEDVLRLVQPRLGRGHARLRGAQGIELIVRFELGHDLSRLDMIADIDRPLDHPARDPKSQTRLVLRLDAAGKGDGFADVALHDGHGPHRTNLRRGGIGFGLAGCEQGRGQPGQHESRARAGIAEQAAHG